MKNNSSARNLAETIYKIAGKQLQPTASHSGFSGNRFFSDSHSGGAKWSGGLSADGVPLHVDHRRTRLNARRAVHDNLNARAIVERYADTVVDSGIRMEAVPMADILGISQDKAESWGEMVSQRFDLWCRSKDSHRAANMNFYQAQRLYAFSQQRDNDNFVRLYYSADKSLMNPLQFDFIDAEQIVGDGLTTTDGFYLAKDGIERDAQGRETGYQVRIIQKDGTTKTMRIPARLRSGRRIMLHGYTPEYAGQGRGYSRLSHVLQELQNMTDFKAAQVMKAINQSQFWMFVKPSKEAPASNIFDGLANAPVGPQSKTGSGSGLALDAETVNIENPVRHFEMDNVNLAIPGSTSVMSLDRGEEIEPFANTAPATDYDKFIDSDSAYISASAGVPIEVMLMRFGSNFSASRAALILFWRIAGIWKHEMSVDLLNPVYASWLAEEIASGEISAPGFSLPILREAWLNANWHGSSLPNIDPNKTASATKTNLELGLTTFEEEARKLNGSSSKLNRVKIKREINEMITDPYNLREKTNG